LISKWSSVENILLEKLLHFTQPSATTSLSNFELFITLLAVKVVSDHTEINRIFDTVDVKMCIASRSYFITHMP